MPAGVQQQRAGSPQMTQAAAAGARRRWELSFPRRLGHPARRADAFCQHLWKSASVYCYSEPTSTTLPDLTLVVGFFLLSGKQCCNSSSRRDPVCEMSSSCEMPGLWAEKPDGKSRAGRQCKKSVMPELSGCRTRNTSCILQKAEFRTRYLHPGRVLASSVQNKKT